MSFDIALGKVGANFSIVWIAADALESS